MNQLQWWRLPSGTYVAAGPTPDESYRIAKRGTAWRVYFGGQEIAKAVVARLAEAYEIAQRHADAAGKRES